MYDLASQTDHYINTEKQGNKIAKNLHWVFKPLSCLRFSLLKLDELLMSSRTLKEKCLALTEVESFLTCCNLVGCHMLETELNTVNYYDMTAFTALFNNTQTLL